MMCPDCGKQLELVGGDFYELCCSAKPPEMIVRHTTMNGRRVVIWENRDEVMHWEAKHGHAIPDGKQDTIEFTGDAIKGYLDKAIIRWRKTKDEVAPGNATDDLVASCYIDAFQSVRMSLFGELLPQSVGDLDSIEEQDNDGTN